MGCTEARLFLRHQPDPYLAGHTSGHLALHGEDVLLIELIALCPEMAFGHGLNYVDRDAHLASRAERRAFQERIYLEIPRNLRQRFRCLPIAENGLMRDHL